MKKLILILFLLTTQCLATDVIIMNGQSNNLGVSKSNGVWTENEFVKIWNSSTKQFENLREGFGFADGWGYEMSLGHELMLHSSTIHIIKCRFPGGSLYEDFRPRTGRYYIESISTILEALSEIPDPNIIAFLWTQGEKDSRFKEWTDAYRGMQRFFIRCVRKDIGKPCMPFIMSGIGATNTTTYKYRDRINGFKSCMVFCMPYAVFFPTLDLSQSDGVHYDNDGLTELGKRYATQVSRFLE